MRIQPFTKGLIIGAIAAAAFFFVTGAVNTDTANTVGTDSSAYSNVACSGDGMIVYVIDTQRVFRSSDGGHNWSVVLQKPNAQNPAALN